MVQQILYGFDVDAVFKQMSRKGIAEAVDESNLPPIGFNSLQDIFLCATILFDA
jgi:hypothetical protein